MNVIDQSMRWVAGIKYIYKKPIIPASMKDTRSYVDINE